MDQRARSSGQPGCKWCARSRCVITRKRPQILSRTVNTWAFHQMTILQDDVLPHADMLSLSKRDPTFEKVRWDGQITRISNLPGPLPNLSFEQSNNRPSFMMMRWDRMVAQQIWFGVQPLYREPNHRKERWDGLCGAVDRPIESTHHLTIVTVDEDSHPSRR